MKTEINVYYMVVETDGRVRSKTWKCVLHTDDLANQNVLGGEVEARQIGEGRVAYYDGKGQINGLQENAKFPGVFGPVLIARPQPNGDLSGFRQEESRQIKVWVRDHLPS